MNIAILCDFDETAAQQNVAHIVLNRFGESEWRALQQQFHEGTLRAREYFERPFDGVTASRDEMQRYVREHGSLRAGFVDLAHYCRERGIEPSDSLRGLNSCEIRK